MRTLADLRVGEEAVVAEVDGDDEISIRLMEMGVVPGATVVKLGAAPLGDPLEFQIRGYHLSL